MRVASLSTLKLRLRSLKSRLSYNVVSMNCSSGLSEASFFHKWFQWPPTLRTEAVHARAVAPSTTLTARPGGTSQAITSPPPIHSSHLPAKSTSMDPRASLAFKYASSDDDSGWLQIEDADATQLPVEGVNAPTLDTSKGLLDFERPFRFPPYPRLPFFFEP